ncbi:MAG: class I SAM-dependent methyltransferase [bacterium]
MNFKCRICENRDTKEFLIGNTPLIECRNCGAVFNKNMPSQEFLENYYKKEYKISEEDFNGLEKRRIFRFPEQIELISKIIHYQKPPAKILDIGSDRGFFLDEARRFGYLVKGLEPLEQAAEYCKSIGIDVYNNLNQINETFDIITLWHSLEHHLVPKQSLEQIRNFLTDSGYLFIRVPAFDSLARKLFGNKWIWFQPENHYYHYSINSLSFVIESSGFSLVHIEHRKPNNRLTKLFNKLSNRTFQKYFKQKISFKKKISRFYQDTAGVEIFAVAKKK